MEGAGVIVILLLLIIGFLILVAIIRYGVDTSKTSKKIDNLYYEVRALRAELDELKNKPHVIDERI